MSWDIVTWKKTKLKKALEIFKLNTLLFPNDGNVYDSYGEALLNAKNISEAKKMYKKSLELNPDNKNAIRTVFKVVK